MVVYSIADRPSFQTAVQLIKNIREKELADNPSPAKRHAPIILVGNKSDLVRKRAVTKESKSADSRHALTPSRVCPSSSCATRRLSVRLQVRGNIRGD